MPLEFHVRKMSENMHQTNSKKGRKYRVAGTANCASCKNGSFTPNMVVDYSQSWDNDRPKFASVRRNRYLGRTFSLTNFFVATFNYRYTSYKLNWTFSYTALTIFGNLCTFVLPHFRAQNCDWCSCQCDQKFWSTKSPPRKWDYISLWFSHIGKFTLKIPLYPEFYQKIPL